MSPVPSPPAAAGPPGLAGRRWRLRLLGDLQLDDGHTPLRLPGRPAALLLARLALHPQRAHPREELVELLWPGVDLAVGRNRLRQTLSTLKALLEGAGGGPVLRAERQLLRLVPDALDCDVPAFEAAWRARRLPEARALYRGELLPGIYDEWVVDERLRLAALADRLAALPEAPAPALPEASAPTLPDAHAAALREAPARPEAPAPALPAPAPRPPAVAVRCPLPRYLTRWCGGAAAGAALQQRVRGHRLVTLLGPGGVGKTRLAVEVAQAERDGRTAAAADGFDQVLFLPLADCADAATWHDALWLALGAPAGLGPPAAPPAPPAPGAAGSSSPSAAAALAAWAQGVAPLLAGQRVLVLLDNFEQLVPAGTPLVAALLAHCPDLHLLVTSRRPLELDGEQTVVLAPLALPPALPPGLMPAGMPAGTPAPQADLGPAATAQPGFPTAPAAGHPALRAEAHSLADDAALAGNPAVALFVDRARAVRADFHLSARNRAAVVALVRLLEGLPLAIELAAARVRSLAPPQLLALLQAALADGTAPEALAWLARSGPRAGADGRHASMLAVVRWSWSLLGQPARRLLARLSVFAGGCTMGAALAVGAADPVDGADPAEAGPDAHADARAEADASPQAVALALDELVAHSMLQALPAAGGWRYRPWELVRQAAVGELDAAERRALRARHRRWLAGWLASRPLDAPLQPVRDELPNLAAALQSADADGCPEDAAALLLGHAAALGSMALPPRALAAATRCAARLADATLRARLQALLARQALIGGDTAVAAELAACAAADLPAAGLARAQVLTRVAHVRWRLARDPDAEAQLREALALAEAGGDAGLAGSALANLGAVLRGRDPAAAIALQRRAIAAWSAAGDRHGESVGRCNLAIALQGAGPAAWSEGLAVLQRALADTAADGDALQHAVACNIEGELLCRLRRWADAAAAYRRCIATAQAAGEPWPMAYGLWNLPRPLAHLGQAAEAARLMGHAQRHAQAVTGPPTASDRHELRRLRRLCERQLGAEATAQAWQAGAGWTLQRALQQALAGGLEAPAAPPPDPG